MAKLPKLSAADLPEVDHNEKVTIGGSNKKNLPGWGNLAGRSICSIAELQSMQLKFAIQHTQTPFLYY